MSMISNAITNVSREASDSNSSNYPFNIKKRSRQDTSVSASRFKGVVCQQNGHWGAQIYANHQRIWLGTFKSEKEAAMAYDSATIKLRSGDSHRNFPWTNINVQEPNFQSQFSTDAVLTMIKDGSYQSKFEDFLRMQYKRGDIDFGLSLLPVHANGGFLCRLLFQKELTPSDVGKLNRLVIPKKCALKYFPHISEGAEENVASGEVDDMQLVFHDRLMRSWKFRYCYWKSSQSFVFTRGWSRFVKEKELKEKDTVIFSVCECKDGSNEGEGRTFSMIDISYNDGVESNGGVVEDINKDVGVQGALQLDMGQHVDGEDEEEFGKATLQIDLGRNSHGGEDEKEEGELVSIESNDAERKVLRLFGVQII
uniref:AP2/ERF transcription factor n=1 Tax=Camptotheca acuminata TaxID=16922 RepID=A0A7G8AU95_CAMAC|nr:AP2/ERF transcription factor [Camptotheca acuminata]